MVMIYVLTNGYGWHIIQPYGYVISMTTVIPML
jgi:hypothetical protein